MSAVGILPASANTAAINEFTSSAGSEQKQARPHPRAQSAVGCFRPPHEPCMPSLSADDFLPRTDAFSACRQQVLQLDSKSSLDHTTTDQPLTYFRETSIVLRSNRFQSRALKDTSLQTSIKSCATNIKRMSNQPICKSKVSAETNLESQWSGERQLALNDNFRAPTSGIEPHRETDPNRTLTIKAKELRSSVYIHNAEPVRSQVHTDMTPDANGHMSSASSNSSFKHGIAEGDAKLDQDPLTPSTPELHAEMMEFADFFDSTPGTRQPHDHTSPAHTDFPGVSPGFGQHVFHSQAGYSRDMLGQADTYWPPVCPLISAAEESVGKHSWDDKFLYVIDPMQPSDLHPKPVPGGPPTGNPLPESLNGAIFLSRS
ncbi:hypothetical protein IF1G_11061 [Cordyceps javanica]|uniref:Uncharacterized protein n=1 Tax=Cordyceps javanica TaxID=43265 RepID=A0A545ULG0_9HYPO|nr:hypothetical protein IF1G_11061 [Cordyceps javanica]